VRFFENWFLGHVQSGDREFAAYVKREFPALFAGARRKLSASGAVLRAAPECSEILVPAVALTSMELTLCIRPWPDTVSPGGIASTDTSSSSAAGDIVGYSLDFGIQSS